MFLLEDLGFSYVIFLCILIKWLNGSHGKKENYKKMNHSYSHVENNDTFSWK